jgi:hypothetical protein
VRDAGRQREVHVGHDALVQQQQVGLASAVPGRAEHDLAQLVLALGRAIVADHRHLGLHLAQQRQPFDQ